MDCGIVDQRQDVLLDGVQSSSAGEQPDRTKGRVAARLGRDPLLFSFSFVLKTHLNIASTAGAVWNDTPEALRALFRSCSCERSTIYPGFRLGRGSP